MAYRVEAKSVDRKGNPKRKFQFFGKTKSAALANAKNYFRKTRNVAAGFYDDQGVFHPIEVTTGHGPKRSNRRRNRSRRRNRFDTARERAAYAAGLSTGSRKLGSAVEKLREKRATRLEKMTGRGLGRKNPKRRLKVRRTKAHGPARVSKKTNRRRKNKMPAALARYWRTHKRTGKAKNRRRK
jgi:hypothetical protein